MLRTHPDKGQMTLVLPDNIFYALAMGFIGALLQIGVAFVFDALSGAFPYAMFAFLGLAGLGFWQALCYPKNQQTRISALAVCVLFICLSILCGFFWKMTS
jgi:hypothetical protein